MDLETIFEDYLFHMMVKREDVLSVEPYDKFQILVTKKNGNRYIYDMMAHGDKLLKEDESVFFKMDEKTYMSEFAFIVDTKITAKGITLEDLSERTGISIPTIYRYMRGDSIPNLYKAKKLADVLGCDINEFFRISK